MDQLGQIRIALKVAELGSFAAAARALKLSTGAVSQSVARLEGQLGLRVFERNTRQVRQTVQGEQLLDRLRPLVRAMDGVLEPGLSRQPVRGVLTVELSESFANAVVIPRLPQFMARHPALSLIIHLSERATNLSREPIDVALRTVEPIEPAARYRRLRAFALVPVGWSTWITRSLADQAEKAGSIQVAVIQLANTCGAAIGGVALDHLGLTSPLVLSGTLMLLTALLVAGKVKAK